MHESEQPRNTEYLDKRLAELNISDKQNTFTRIWIQPSSRKDDDGKIITEDHRHERDYKVFDADSEGNIVIHYFNLEGQPYRWKKDGTTMTRDYIRKRLRDPKGSMKYFQESGSPQFPFFNPEIITKYKRAKYPELFTADKNADDQAALAEDGTIDTLFLVEGEFKARAGQLAGIDIVGLPSIHGFYNGDVKGKLHEDIQELLIICKAKKIVFLVDADLLSVKWEADKDLANRPLSFYGAIKSYRESLQLLLDDDNERVPLELIYFMHINSKFMNDAKGLDDLLSKYTAKHDEIIEDLYSFQFAKKYFTGKLINDLNKDVNGGIYRYLGLTDEKEFYKIYGDFIDGREFKFKRRRYIYNQEEKEVKFVRHEDAAKFLRVGPSWVKVVTRKNKFEQIEQIIVPWKIAEITRDYRRFPDFIEQIQRYDAFCNEPAWNGSYKRSVNNCYNLCEPLSWQPAPGGIAATIKFLKHIFQGKGTVSLDDYGIPVEENNITGDPFTVILDWLTLIIQRPKEPLPVPILVSPENNTGKSTFLKWLQILFGTNMVILGNEQFKMKFNAHYITKFIIAIDEGFLEVDKKAEKERLKQMVTADDVYLEYKGMNVEKVDYYGKLVMCSNDADRVMKIDDGESRWFVVRVPVLTEKDPDLKKKLAEEMPAWLHYVQNRTVHHPRADRLWFKAEWFITEQFKIIVESTKNRLERVFEDWIREQFMLYRLSTLRYSMTHLVDAMNDSKTNKYKVDKIELRAFLTARNVEYDKRPQRFSMPSGIDIPEGDSGRDLKVMMTDCNPTTPYIFRIEKWLSVEDVEKLLPLTDPRTLVMKPVGYVHQPELGLKQQWEQPSQPGSDMDATPF